MNVIQPGVINTPINPYEGNSPEFDAYLKGLELQQKNDSEMAKQMLSAWEAQWKDKIELLVNLDDSDPAQSALKKQGIGSLVQAFQMYNRATGGKLTPQDIAQMVSGVLASGSKNAATPEQMTNILGQYSDKEAESQAETKPQAAVPAPSAAAQPPSSAGQPASAPAPVPSPATAPEPHRPLPRPTADTSSIMPSPLDFNAGLEIVKGLEAPEPANPMATMQNVRKKDEALVPVEDGFVRFLATIDREAIKKASLTTAGWPELRDPKTPKEKKLLILQNMIINQEVTTQKAKEIYGQIVSNQPIAQPEPKVNKIWDPNRGGPERKKIESLQIDFVEPEDRTLYGDLQGSSAEAVSSVSKTSKPIFKAVGTKLKTALDSFVKGAGAVGKALTVDVLDAMGRRSFGPIKEIVNQAMNYIETPATMSAGEKARLVEKFSKMSPDELAARGFKDLATIKYNREELSKQLSARIQELQVRASNGEGSSEAKAAEVKNINAFYDSVKAMSEQALNQLKGVLEGSKIDLGTLKPEDILILAKSKKDEDKKLFKAYQQYSYLNFGTFKKLDEKGRALIEADEKDINGVSFDLGGLFPLKYIETRRANAIASIYGTKEASPGLDLTSVPGAKIDLGGKSASGYVSGILGASK